MNEKIAILTIKEIIEEVKKLETKEQILEYLEKELEEISKI